ncbi:hypothetical protein CMK19_03885 [Candidatus Poribacteria bacterium]|nr:hypothetical protein [Candidatus Poribacteria bacterium]
MHPFLYCLSFANFVLVVSRFKPTLINYIMIGLKGLCVECREANITKGYFRIKEYCKACGAKVEKNNGDSWAFLIFIDRAVFLFPLIVALFFRLNLKVFIILSILVTACMALFTSKRLSLSIAIERWLSGKFKY